MKRRLTLAIGCLAAAMPSVSSAAAPARTVNVAPAQTSRFSLLDATQAAHGELEKRGLSPDHTIASVVLLKGVQAGTGSYDARIEPPATLEDGQRLRGFCVGLDGSIVPVNGFRAKTD